MTSSPSAYVTVTRRALDVEDYIDILRRHRGWIIAPLFAGLVIAVVVAFLWPDTYVSYAILRITPPQVSENLLPTILTTQLAERVNQLRQEIMSRSSLSSLITNPRLDLYKKERQRSTMEDVLDEMKKKIKIEMIDSRGRTIAFQISFAYPDRVKAQAVVAELVTRFTENNVRAQTQQAGATQNFLTEEYRSAKERMEALDNQMSAFRTQNAGRLPEQMGANMQAQNNLQMQLSGIHETLSRLAQEKMLLETTLQNLKNQSNFIAAGVEQTGSAAANDRLIQLNRAISDTELSLSGLREIYKEDHPDIRRFKAQMEVLKRERDLLSKDEQQEQAKTKGKKVLNVQAVRSLEDVKMQIASVNSHIQAKNLETEEKLRQQEHIIKQIQAYQARIDASPVNEQKWFSLLREFEMSKQKYEEMSRKKQLAEQGGRIEGSKVGENLEVMEPAVLPEQASEPHRLAIAGMGIGMGLMMGLFLAGAKEMKDTSLKNLKDVRAYTNLAILSSIPLLENALLVRRKRRMFWLAWATAIMVGMCAMGASMYYYYFVSKI